MERDQLQDQLMDHIRTRYEIPADDDDFSENVNLFDYGYIDSFGAVEIYTHLESKYGVSINEGVLMKIPLRTVAQMVDFIADQPNSSKS